MKTIVIVVLGVAVIIAVAFLRIMVIDFVKLRLIRNPEPWFGTQSFDATVWQSGAASDRGQMVRDLVSRRLLSGLSHNQVLELLGEPNGRNQEPDISKSGKIVYYYTVKPAAPPPDASQWTTWSLIIVLKNRTGRVVGYGVSKTSS